MKQNNRGEFIGLPIGYCSKCNHENMIVDKFCPQCGQAIDWINDES